MSQNFVPFDPNLLPAAFPTLPLDQFPPEKTQKTVSNLTINQVSPETESPPPIIFQENLVLRDPSVIEQSNMFDYSEPQEFEPWNGEEDLAQLRQGLPVN